MKTLSRAVMVVAVLAVGAGLAYGGVGGAKPVPGTRVQNTTTFDWIWAKVAVFLPSSTEGVGGACPTDQIRKPGGRGVGGAFTCSAEGVGGQGQRIRPPKARGVGGAFAYSAEGIGGTDQRIRPPRAKGVGGAGPLVAEGVGGAGPRVSPPRNLGIGGTD